ncbi:unnamed protein product, partial [Oppiella nova]
MFWIHGGGLVNGSIFNMPPYNGLDLAAYDVVVVSTNYRLGPFGFLYGDREDAPGNVGFYDQLLALKWVRENIHQFGGDRDRITIFGESAGSISVSSQILSPLSKGLYKRAIMESGAHLYNKDRDSLNKTEAVSEAKQMAKQLNCSETEDWLQCLRKVDAKDILKLEKSISTPVFGTEFLPVYTHKALDDHLLNYDIDLMSGLTRNEGPILVDLVLKQINLQTVDDFKKYVKVGDELYHGLDVQKVSDFYLNGVNTSSPAAIRRAYTDFFGDLMMNCPTYLFAKHLAQIVKNKHNVYFYEWTYQSQYFSKLMGCDEATMGICHGAD